MMAPYSSEGILSAAGAMTLTSVAEKAIHVSLLGPAVNAEGAVGVAVKYHVSRTVNDYDPKDEGESDRKSVMLNSNHLTLYRPVEPENAREDLQKGLERRDDRHHSGEPSVVGEIENSRFLTAHRTRCLKGWMEGWRVKEALVPRLYATAPSMPFFDEKSYVREGPATMLYTPSF
jgi:hypothetical protein